MDCKSDGPSSALSMGALHLNAFAGVSQRKEGSSGASSSSPLVIKTEPQSQRSPCVSSMDYSSVGGKRSRTTDDFLLSPNSMAMDTSPMSGHPFMGPGFSPMSTTCSDPYSPNGREDMSPPGSINGYPVDSFGESKKKKGPTPRQQEELCLVCGDRASGYHYNALTCEGCKGFFRRSITKNAVYQCKYGNNCEIDMYMRRKCQECRLKKCLNVGMRPECVVPEYQCAVKREAKRAQKEKDRPNSTTKEHGSPPDTPVKEDMMLPTPKEKEPVSNKLTPEEQELIERLVYFQEEFESPSNEDLKKITAFPFTGDDLQDDESRFKHITEITILTVQLIVEYAKRIPGFNTLQREDQITLLKHFPFTGEDGESRFKHITEITILTVQLIVEFSKRLPGFDTLQREDQITLLKGCSSEVMMLRTARRYDINTDSIVFANDQPYTRENYNSAGVGDSADDIFHFCQQMCVMKVDNAEYALLTAIVIFSERPHLIEPKKVEKIQEIYLEALRKYVENHRSKSVNMFARLLSVLTELRTLGNLNSELCFSLKLKNKKLPPFLAEIWDIQC